MNSYELIDHTADIGIKVRGKTLKDLFVNAAKAMFDIMMEKRKGTRMGNAKKVRVHVEAGSLEEIFVRWLSELLSLSDWKDVVFTKFMISELSPQRLEAAIEDFPRKFFESQREIKAVTHHALKIVKEARGYSASVIFDV